jgi:hypothetical protein
VKNILICLAFVVVSAMGETNNKIDETKIERNLSQEERFNMLFGKTGLSFHQIRKERDKRHTRSNRVIENEIKVIDITLLTQEERYELLFGKKELRQRVARTTRFIFPRQARRSLYISCNL